MTFRTIDHRIRLICSFIKNGTSDDDDLTFGKWKDQKFYKIFRKFGFDANFSILGVKIMVHMHPSMIPSVKAIEFLSKENIKVSRKIYLRENDVMMTSLHTSYSNIMWLHLCWHFKIWVLLKVYLRKASPQLKCSTLKGVSLTNPIFYLSNV